VLLLLGAKRTARSPQRAKISWKVRSMVNKTELPDMLEQLRVKGKKQRPNTIYYLVLPLLAGLAWTLWTFFQAQNLNGYIAEIADREMQLKELDIQLEEVNNAIALQKQTLAALLEARNETYEPLQPPTPEYPKSGHPIPMPQQNYFFYFQWSPVESASNYSLEVDCLGCGQLGEWYSHSGSPWHLRSGLGFRSTIYSSRVHLNSGYHILRWRVWASDSEGREGRKSEWIYFTFSAQLPTASDA